MPINFMSDGASGASEKSDILGDIVNGYGVVPDYVDLGVPCLRTDDAGLADRLADHLGAAREDHGVGDAKRPHYVVCESGELPLTVEYVSTSLQLRSRATGQVIRTCDGVRMKDDEGEEKACACAAAGIEVGSADWRSAAKDGLACKPTGLVFASVPGFDVEGRFVFSKSSESTVRPFVDLEAGHGQDLPVSVVLTIETITSKRGFSWSVPRFSVESPVVL